MAESPHSGDDYLNSALCVLHFDFPAGVTPAGPRSKG